MIIDLGLNLYRGNLDGLDGLEPDDLEVRKRLYLSAFAWDKYAYNFQGRTSTDSFQDQSVSLWDVHRPFLIFHSPPIAYVRASFTRDAPS